MGAATIAMMSHQNEPKLKKHSSFRILLRCLFCLKT
ncbi:unnamed protein product [Brassica oleracea]